MTSPKDVFTSLLDRPEQLKNILHSIRQQEHLVSVGKYLYVREEASMLNEKFQLFIENKGLGMSNLEVSQHRDGVCFRLTPSSESRLWGIIGDKESHPTVTIDLYFTKDKKTYRYKAQARFIEIRRQKIGWEFGWHNDDRLTIPLAEFALMETPVYTEVQ